MTKWQEFPLRPQGRPWTGINTRSGKLDDGTGQMTDDSINVIINRGDQLEKRKGLIRGLDERFFGPVCGLHTYTDECGIEYLLVADQAGFSIRQPFDIPSFANSDAYPSDSFDSDGPVDGYSWSNTEGYEQAGGALVLKAGQTAPGPLTWFKLATNFSYQVTINYTIDDDSTVSVQIKRAALARIEARIVRVGGSGTVSLIWIDATGGETELAIGSIGTVGSGSVVLSYNRDVVSDKFTARIDSTPTGGVTFVLQDFETINAVEDADLGQGTALELISATGVSSGTVVDVQGEPL